MKKIAHLVGLISTMAFVTGSTFGILHLPGATELSFYGFLGFAFLYLPLYAIDYYRANVPRTLQDKLKVAFGLLSGIMVAASMVFKFMHLPGLPTFFMVAGTTLFVLGFLPLLFFGMYKKSVS